MYEDLLLISRIEQKSNRDCFFINPLYGTKKGIQENLVTCDICA